MKGIIYRLTPSAVVAAALAWCCWPYLGFGNPTFDPQGLAKLPVIDLQLLDSQQQIDCERDPFRPLRALAAMVETAASPTGETADGEPSAPPADPAETIEQLTLNATLIRGACRRAIIDGKTYEEGDALPTPIIQDAPFLIERIASQKVTIEHDGTCYALRYRDALPKARPVSTEHSRPIPPAKNPNPPS
jgi:hypothetical protein